VKNNKKLDLIIFSILQVMDDVGPQIVITYPENGTYFAKTVVIEGFVIDLADSGGDHGEVLSLSYEIDPAETQRYSYLAKVSSDTSRAIEISSTGWDILFLGEVY
jgi:hypothetical protein